MKQFLETPVFKKNYSEYDNLIRNSGAVENKPENGEVHKNCLAPWPPLRHCSK